MQSVSEEKKRLRAVMKQRRRRLSREEMVRADKAILDRVSRLLQNEKPGQLLSYVSVPGSEVDTRALLQYALDSDIPVAVPKCTDRPGEMIFCTITSLSGLVTSRYGIDEPDESICPRADISSGGICIVPALAFDRRGFRLGYGGGYYDRFLPGFTGMKIGLCYECCLEEILPSDGFDIKADAVITEADTYRFDN